MAGHLCNDPELGARLDRRPLPPLPGAFDPFEVAVRAVVGQQVSVAGAATTLGRLVDLVAGHDPTPDPESSAESPPDDPIRHHGFPDADRVAAAPLDRLAMPTRRRETILQLARAVASGHIDLSNAADPRETEARLLDVAGIGPWTAGYIAMRALGDPDGWPVGDLVLRRSLARTSADAVGAGSLEARAERWRPWRGYAAMLLWATAGTDTSAEPHDHDQDQDQDHEPALRGAPR